MNSKNAVIIIAFNNARLIDKMIYCIRLLCVDEPDIIVYDNGTIPLDGLAYVSDGIIYRRSLIPNYNPSDSHSNACHLEYRAFSKRYDKLLFLDHDCFPITKFSITEMVDTYLLAGVGQTKSKLYVWPGCVAFNCEALLGEKVNFSTDQELALDTGGHLYELIEKYGMSRCRFFDEISEENIFWRNQAHYQNYSLIKNGTFMHFINASGWNKEAENNHERIEVLFNILDGKLSSTVE